MLQTISMDTEFTKRLDILRRSGKKAVIAATKAEVIIQRMQSGKVRPRRAGSVTKHGEARIKGITKYDLGSGYRLVTYKQGDTCYLLYIGTHDECHRWIENNREFDIRMVEGRCSVLSVQRQKEEPDRRGFDTTDLEAMAEDNFNLLQDIGERDLRIIFNGLIESTP